MLHTVTCEGCEDIFTFSLDPKALEAWQAGVHVQQAFPELSDDERELLISGTCGACWEEMFPEEEESDYWPWGPDPLEESDYPEYQSDYYVDRDCD